MNKHKLVPVEPTEAMIDAARDIHEGERYLPTILYTDIYKAMLAAAPAVQGEPETMKLYDKYRRGVE